MVTVLIWVLVGEITLLAALVAALVLTLRGGKDEKTAPPVPEKVQRNVPPVAQTARPGVDAVIVQGMARYATRFTGLYEALYMAAQSNDGSVPDAYREWHVRMMKLQEDRVFYGAFLSRFPEAGITGVQLKSLLEHMDAAGIRRQSIATHVADGQTKDRYIYLGAEPVCMGKAYRVAKPCWLLGETTVEQGVLMPGGE